MLNLTPADTKAGLRILCLGAHCDDIEIGCGGTILRLLERYPDAHVYWVVLSSSPDRAREAGASAERFLRNSRQSEIVIKDFRNSFFPFVGAQIKEYFEELASRVSPDLVFTHSRQDLHQDHRLTCDLTWNTFRDHLILEYEIPKYDGDIGPRNLFVPLEEEHYEAKVAHLLQYYASQRTKHWFTRETFLALMRLRGIESNALSGYAEGFGCRKIVMSLLAKTSCPPTTVPNESR
jgi:LmbE family N-acetylglucosaminyl deacetylase